MTGDGMAMAWKAGAELTLMERSGILMLGTGYKHTWYVAQEMPAMRISSLSTLTGRNYPGRLRDGRMAALWDLLRMYASLSERAIQTGGVGTTILR